MPPFTTLILQLYRLTFWSRHDPRVRNIVKGDDDHLGQTYPVGTQTQEELAAEESKSRHGCYKMIYDAINYYPY